LRTLRQWASYLLTRSGILFMRLLAMLPLVVVRAMGKLLGWVLYVLVASRRRVVTVNLSLCFPELSPDEILAGQNPCRAAGKAADRRVSLPRWV